MLILNKEQLEVVKKDIDFKFAEYGRLQVDIAKPAKDKSLNQLGYIFGGLVEAIRSYFAEAGEQWAVNDIKENLYRGCALLDDNLRHRINKFNGESYEVPLRLSEMNREQASLFIDRCLYLLDNSKVFEGLVLHPSLRYTWVMHLDKNELRNLSDADIPDRDAAYLSYIRKQACIWCGRCNNTEAHHLRESGLSGTGIKAKDAYTLPLCDNCHRYKLHQNGVNDFMEAMKWITKYVPLETFCLCCYNRWKNKV